MLLLEENTEYPTVVCFCNENDCVYLSTLLAIACVLQFLKQLLLQVARKSMKHES